MRYTLPPLNSLRAFEAAARRQSIALAAKELCVTQGAVSRHVNNLESFLGERLFRRTHRGIEPTPRGLALQAATHQAFNTIAEATQLVMTPTRAAPVRLNLAPTFAMRWLVPRLSQFYRRHPDVVLEMSTSQRPCAADFGEFDATIDYCEDTWPGMEAEQLFESIVIPVCSPTLADGAAPPARPEDIARHTLLHSLNRPYLWPNWLSASGAGGIAANVGPRFQNSSLVYQAASDGLGIGIGEVAFLIDDIEGGRLVAPFPPHRDVQGSYYLLRPRGEAAKPGLVAFRKWLMDEAAASNRRVRERWNLEGSSAAGPAPERGPAKTHKPALRLVEGHDGKRR
jgi:LysR family glycine cleavage system transcriptional activator